jgi:hypothetical protein
MFILPRSLLKAARPERLTANMPVDPDVPQLSKGFLIFFFSLPPLPPPPTVAGAPTFLALLTLTVLGGSSSVSEGVDPYTMPSP